MNFFVLKTSSIKNIFVVLLISPERHFRRPNLNFRPVNFQPVHQGIRGAMSAKDLGKLTRAGDLLYIMGRNVFRTQNDKKSAATYLIRFFNTGGTILKVRF